MLGPDWSGLAHPIPLGGHYSQSRSKAEQSQLRQQYRRNPIRGRPARAIYRAVSLTQTDNPDTFRPSAQAGKNKEAMPKTCEGLHIYCLYFLHPGRYVGCFVIDDDFARTHTHTELWAYYTRLRVLVNRKLLRGVCHQTK